MNNAIISECGKYRYRLTRIVDAENPKRLCFVMLNPSTADATADDPTIRRCIGYTRSFGYGILEVVNLFALRATDKRILDSRHSPVDPVGPLNHEHILKAVAESDTVVAAWGCWLPRRFAARGHDICKMISDAPDGKDIYNLGVTSVEWMPKHPLYLRADETLRLFYKHKRTMEQGKAASHG